MKFPKYSYNLVSRHTSKAVAAHRRDLWPSEGLRMVERIQAGLGPNYVERNSQLEINLHFDNDRNALGLLSALDYYG